ncbi:CinA domain protein [Pseudopedobacter saltans DSM 12145]|uniref:CinA domain protein n=1 Tax=Pseudopedobacter saltans (strain ATCC 51119 / DSM 12145 / JCM 21818 / CCUG 39354 / LMG 10337 / NBRC 100064 / NCIMB 13643) TaxID=762903 RepID=F0S7B5_PSESL|nr:CinA family protein [Pseudopedobacter saltans]ADY51140.1 CinA domain protein [Pseudopedobacter saltans DSM 12145]
MDESIIAACLDKLREKALTIAFAESVTVGALCHEFGMLPAVGDVFKGGLVCYDGEVKKEYLGVEDELIERYSPESAEVTAQMVKGLERFFKADISVAITGLSQAGGSESISKPVGTVFYNILYRDKLNPYRKLYKGDAKEIIAQAVEDVFCSVYEIIH